MVKSLNEVYENNELLYYCNAAGDIHIPGADPWAIHQPDELPLPALELYENFWTEGAGLTMYVVKYKDVTTIAVCALFDYSYMDDLDEQHRWGQDKDAFWQAVKHTAKQADMLTDFPMVTLVGEDTDPDGHEILFILPPDKCAEAADFAETFGDYIYDAFEVEYHAALFWAKRSKKAERK